MEGVGERGLLGFPVGEGFSNPNSLGRFIFPKILGGISVVERVITADVGNSHDWIYGYVF